MGVDFDNSPLQPVTVTDTGGVEHTFEFRSMLVATGHALHAREALPAGREGYEFSVLGDFEANVWDLFKELYDRIRRALAVRHVECGELGWQITDAHRRVTSLRPQGGPHPRRRRRPMPERAARAIRNHPLAVRWAATTRYRMRYNR